MAACPGEAWHGEADLVAAPSTPRKRRRLPPAQAVVYVVLKLCLFSGADSAAPPGYRSVMRWLTNGMRHLHGLALPASSALTTFSLIPNIEAGAAARWPWVQAAGEVQ
jgi:hypothetical protein